MLLLSLLYSSLWFDVGFLDPPPHPPPPRATSMSTPPSNFYMIRWHSFLLFTLYTHQHVISHFLGMFHFLSPPPPHLTPQSWLENEPSNFIWCPLKNEIQKVSFFCCRQWKICPKGPTFVGYFEVEIQTPYSKTCHPWGIAEKWGTSLCRRSSHSPSKLLVYTAQNVILQGFFWSLNDNGAFHS